MNKIDEATKAIKLRIKLNLPLDWYLFNNIKHLTWASIHQDVLFLEDMLDAQNLNNNVLG